VLLCWWWEEK